MAKKEISKMSDDELISETEEALEKLEKTLSF